MLNTWRDEIKKSLIYLTYTLLSQFILIETNNNTKLIETFRAINVIILKIGIHHQFHTNSIHHNTYEKAIAKIPQINAIINFCILFNLIVVIVENIISNIYVEIFTDSAIKKFFARYSDIHRISINKYPQKMIQKYQIYF